MRTVYASHSEFIDPLDCGSTVSFRISGGDYFEADVVLTDCNRRIDWSFNDDESALEKIDRVIEILCKFRGALFKAQIRQAKETAKKEAEKKKT